MGNEVNKKYYKQKDFDLFQSKLVEETRLLRQQLQNNEFDNDSFRIGYELEVCLLDQSGLPNPINQEIIDRTHNRLFTAELAQYNLEINGHPFDLAPSVFNKLEGDINLLYSQANQTANELKGQLGLFGVLPCLNRSHLKAENYMSDLNRYHLISDTLLKMRQRPVHLKITGEDTLDICKHDVMLEALGTSFQIHFQVPIDQYIDYYHASLWASLVMIAISANSPLVLGKSCWHESRIAIFKQAVDTRTLEEKAQGVVPRVFFSKGYINSVMDLFEDNLNYQVILPEVSKRNTASFHHLSLHNGTVWRWIRPIIGESPNEKNHLRLELRVLPSGPTIIDSVSNLVFFIALIEGLKNHKQDLIQVPYDLLDTQFYKVARGGLSTPITWFNQQKASVQEIVLQHCMKLAKEGIKSLKISKATKWLEIIEQRVKSQQTGASWILDFWHKNPDANSLVNHYLQNANQDIPVHLWRKP